MNVIIETIVVNMKKHYGKVFNDYEYKRDQRKAPDGISGRI